MTKAMYEAEQSNVQQEAIVSPGSPLNSIGKIRQKTANYTTSETLNNAIDLPNVTNPKRMSISLAGDAAQLLEILSRSQGITQNEALRKAIATEAYIRQEVSQGAKVLLQKSSGEIREVVFR